MAFVGGLFLRLTQTILRTIQLLASILVLGVFSYFLAVLANHDLSIAARYKAVEGIAGAAVLYGIFCVLLTLFLGGISFFAFLAIVLDVCFAGGFVVIAYFNRGGTDNCNSGNVNTPLGDGPVDASAPGFGGDDDNLSFRPNLRRACMLEKAVFAVAIVNIILFIVTAFFQVLLVRHHNKEKRYGPSPSNNYTSGSGRRPFWKRNKHRRNTRDAELATAGAHDKHGIRPSGETGYTGTTVDNHNAGHGYGHHTTTTTSTNY